MPMLVEVRKVSQRFAGVSALDDVSLEIPEGSFTVLLGPSGSGKTTLLNIIGGFIAPSEGRVMIAGADITELPPAKRPTATVFQDYALFPHMTVGANVAFGLRMRGISLSDRARRAQEMLRLVGLEEAFDRKPHQLSGGQRQRVALARSLAVEPKVLLLDEPLGALDLRLRRQMQDELKSIQKRVGTTFIHVTHDQEEAMALADLIVVMNKGRIEDQGEPQRVYSHPGSCFTATFMGESTLIEGTVRDIVGEVLVIVTALGTLRASGSAKLGQKVTVAIRPEHIRLTAAGEDMIVLGDVRVEEATFQGAFIRAVAKAKNGMAIQLRAEPGSLPAIGQSCTAYVRASDLTILTR